VPLSALQGRDTRPFGEDFAIWYQAITSPRLPPALMADSAPPESDGPDPNYHDPVSPYAEPLGTEGGERLVAEAPVGAGNARTRLTHFNRIEAGWDAPRQAGIRPAFDADAEWRAAEIRAGRTVEAEARAVERSAWVDPLFAAVFGRRGGR